MCLGTDAATCDNKYDMFDAMRLVAIIHKGRIGDPLVVPAETAIEMATINGAKSMKKDDVLGSIEIGKKADIITVDCNNFRIAPNIKPVSAIVYSAQGTDVDNVVIDGKFIVKDREILTMNEQEVIDNAKKTIVEVLEKTKIENKPRWKIL